MIRRTARIALEIAGFVIAGFIILTALVAWRLSAGPVALDFLTPYVEDALAGTTAGPVARIGIGGTMLRWRGFERPLDLAATDVVLYGPDDEPIAVLRRGRASEEHQGKNRYEDAVRLIDRRH